MYLLGQPSIINQMAWHSAIRGGFLERIFVYKDEDGETVPSVDIWDWYHTSYAIGKKGMEWASNSRKMTRTQVESEWDIKVSTDEVDVLEHWENETYSVIAGDKWAQEPTKHGQDHTPVYLIRSGSMPNIYSDIYKFTGAHSGESVFAPNRELFSILNKTLSDHLTIVRRGVKVPLGYWSSSGQETIEEDIYQVEKAATVSLRTGDEIKPLIQPTMPADTNLSLRIITDEIQRGSFPSTTYGELGFRLSGFAITQLQSAISTVITPLTQSISKACEMACRESLSQFVKGKFKPIYVMGRTSRNEAFGMPKPQKIKYSDLEGDWYPEVRIEPTLPKDDAQRYELARLAREGEVPLMSDRTIRDELLGVDDPDLEAQQIDGEWADIKLPTVRLFRAYMDALEDGNEDKAMNILAELQQLRLAGAPKQGGAGRGGRGAMSRLGRASMETPGAPSPVGPTGLSPETMPPEVLGGMSPGAIRGMEGA